MTEKTLRALSLVAGYSAVMEDDYSSACSTADLCDLGRETMDWIIENSNRQADLECDSASTIQHIKHEIKQEEGEEDEPERVLLELGIIDRPGDYFGTQDNCIYAPHKPEAISEAGALPNIVSSELDSITIAYNSDGNEGFAYDFYPSDTLLNIPTSISTSSPSPSSSSDIGYPSSLQPSSPSDCGSDFPDFGFCPNNNNISAANGFDSGNESNEAEDNYADDPDYVPLAKKTTLSRRDSNVSSASSTRSSSSSSPKTSSKSTTASSVGKAKITHWLLKVLRSPEHNPSVMRWEDEERGIFRVVDQAELGRMWGIAKNNPDMDYEKFSRAMRYYYKRKELVIVRRKLIYQFGPRMKNWRQ